MSISSFWRVRGVHVPLYIFKSFNNYGIIVIKRISVANRDSTCNQKKSFMLHDNLLENVSWDFCAAVTNLTFTPLSETNFQKRPWTKAREPRITKCGWKFNYVQKRAGLHKITIKLLQALLLCFDKISFCMFTILGWTSLQHRYCSYLALNSQFASIDFVSGGDNRQRVILVFGWFSQFRLQTCKRDKAEMSAVLMLDKTLQPLVFRRAFTLAIAQPQTYVFCVYAFSNPNGLIVGELDGYQRRKESSFRMKRSRAYNALYGKQCIVQ